MWSLGDYAAVAVLLEPGARQLAASCHIRPGGTGEAVEWALPFADESFDVVVSVFGVMFAPRPDRVASEMFRVCRTGGVAAMANYSWTGFLGDYAKLVARYSNPSPMPPDRYAAFRRESEALMDGRELVSSYVLVVARK